ncbi:MULTISPECIES: STAS domain-containing protein [Flammeovirga]|uniref:Anti-sigma factor antagonist n=1 Tax=Flammeovirga agarivorans TaxID=2726742 RepID=A0A7X8SKX2_9BACT|nr:MULTISPECIES: STAS domain-containing protein [Flammeovirga]NLR92003.1 STAS domain-containing protein [Flammeovirga agarivorans]
MDITQEKIKDMEVLTPQGFIDASNSPILEEKIVKMINDEGKDKIILDLKNVSYMSSSGLRVFLSASKNMQAKDGIFRVCNANDVVSEILTVSGFDMIVDIRKTIEEALEG